MVNISNSFITEKAQTQFKQVQQYEKLLIGRKIYFTQTEDLHYLDKG